MSYRFIGLTPRFYPDVRDDEGKSLMALPGSPPRQFPDGPPPDGLWVAVEDVPVSQETPEAPALPVMPTQVIEAVPVLQETPEPASEPEPVQPPKPAWTFPGFAVPAQPYTR